jgi:hypothetical protein
MMGKQVYEIPLSDPIKEFFADSSAINDRVTLEIPNAEIDSPLNWKIRSQLNNTGKIDTHGNTERSLNYSRYYKHPDINSDRLQRADNVTAKDWFFNNINWLFNDVDRTNNAYKDPNKNRFMNVIGEGRTSRASFKPQRLFEDNTLLDTQEGSAIQSDLLSSMKPSSTTSNYAQFDFSGNS